MGAVGLSYVGSVKGQALIPIFSLALSFTHIVRTSEPRPLN